jgi:hypothetical protein
VGIIIPEGSETNQLKDVKVLTINFSGFEEKRTNQVIQTEKPGWTIPAFHRIIF